MKISNLLGWTLAGLLGAASAQAQIAISRPNDGTTGTGLNLIAIGTTASPTAARTALTTTTAGVLGIVIGNAGTTGTALVAYSGDTSCQFDGSNTAGNWAIISTTVAGNCHDSGTASSSAPPAGSVGLSTTTNTGAGVYALGLNRSLPTFTGGGSGTVNSGTSGQLGYYASTGTAISGNANATISGGDLTLGVAGATLGDLLLSGNTSGVVTIKPAAAAGTWSLTLPTTAGTANYFLQTDGAGVTTWAAGGSGLTALTQDVTATGTGSVAATVNSAGAASTNYIAFSGAATTVPVQIAAAGTDTNIGLVLSPKGNGYISAEKPDSTATGGNARGSNAFDLQVSRTAATQVASGALSTIIGSSNSTVSGNNGAVIACTNCQVTTANSLVGGSGTSSTIGGQWGFAFGHNIALTGRAGTAFGDTAVDRGYVGRFAHSSGIVTVAGDTNQTMGTLHISAPAATASTAYVMVSDTAAAGTLNQINLPNNSAYEIRLHGIIMDTGAPSTSYASFNCTPFSAGRGVSAATTTVGSTTCTFTTGAGTIANTATMAVTADTTNGAAAVTLTTPTTIATGTWRATATFETTEVQ